MNPHYPAVAARAQRRCEYCRAPEKVFNFRFEVEHIQPQSASGEDTADNFALAYRACNAFKATFREALAPETGTVVPLFNPRRDDWDAHFLVTNSMEIQGRTATGRATVARLAMNEPFQIEGRLHWKRLELFP